MDFLIINSLLACFAVVLTYAIWAVHNHFFSKPRGILKKLWAQGVPGYPFVPFVGQIPEGLKIRRRRDKDPEYAASTLGGEFFLTINRKYGRLCTFCFGPYVRLMIADPAMLKQAYVNSNESFVKNKFLRALTLLGDGLLTANGEAWAQQRRLINPAFNHREIKRIFPTMWECTEQALSKVASQVKAAPTKAIDMSAIFSTLTLDVICRSAFGSQLDAKFGPTFLGEIVASFHQYLFFRLRGLQIEAVIPLFKYLPTGANLKTWAAEKYLREALDKIIAARLVEKQGQVEGTNEEEEGATDLLELMMSSTGVPEGGLRDSSEGTAGRSLTVDLLKANCLTFLLAGHETTANLLTWSTLLLSQHPDWQQKARNEVNAVSAAGTGKGPSFEQLNELKIVGWILNETLRLYPSAAVVSRTAKQDTKVGDITVPAGCDIALPIVAIHRSKELWGEDADQFRPERFANGTSKAASHPNAFIPFSLGPRTCIGQNFALVEAKIILANFLRRFSWTVSPVYRHHPDLTITMRAKYGLPVELKVIQ